jgi:dihydropteroate synthase
MHRLPYADIIAHHSTLIALSSWLLRPYPPPVTHWLLAHRKPPLVLDAPQVIGILNITPDSFADGGTLRSPALAAIVAERMISEGAIGLDIGGESTRPGAAPVAASEQIARVLPVIQAIRARLGDGPLITIDTTQSAVAAAALDEGADAINDVSGGTDDPQMLPLAAARRCGVILMHRLRPSQTDSYSTHYTPSNTPSYQPAHAGDLPAVVTSIVTYLTARRDAALAAGIAPASIILDPGLGFGKSVEDNLHLIRHTHHLASLGCPILSALSRKSFTAPAAGLAKDTPPQGRLHATLGLSAAHLIAGARLFRVHDVAPHVQMLAAVFSTLHQTRTP